MELNEICCIYKFRFQVSCIWSLHRFLWWPTFLPPLVLSLRMTVGILSSFVPKTFSSHFIQYSFLKICHYLCYDKSRWPKGIRLQQISKQFARHELSAILDITEMFRSPFGFMPKKQSPNHLVLSTSCW